MQKGILQHILNKIMVKTSKFRCTFYPLRFCGNHIHHTTVILHCTDAWIKASAQW